MAVSCQDLIHLEKFQNVRLIAGAAGLFRHVSWPFICTTLSVSQWLHGGELIFITGAGTGSDTESLSKIMREGHHFGLSGVVILTGEGYIKSIPPELEQLADEFALPLFEMPWKLKLIDVTQEISEYIMAQREQGDRQKALLDQLLSFENNQQKLTALLTETALAGYPVWEASILEAEKTDSAREMSEIEDAANLFSSYLPKKELYGGTICSLQDHQLVCLAFLDSEKSAQRLEKLQEEALAALNAFFPRRQFWLAFGRTCQSSAGVRQSYREAGKTLSLLRQGLFGENSLSYSQLGIFRLFFEIENPKELRLFCAETIGPLQQSDAQNKTALVQTLWHYLNHNGNLVKTAQSLYIHRNTLVYRLNCIENLLGKSLDNAKIRQELYLGLLADRYLSTL